MVADSENSGEFYSRAVFIYKWEIFSLHLLMCLNGFFKYEAEVISLLYKFVVLSCVPIIPKKGLVEI